MAACYRFYFLFFFSPLCVSLELLALFYLGCTQPFLQHRKLQHTLQPFYSEYSFTLGYLFKRAHCHTQIPLFSTQSTVCGKKTSFCACSNPLEAEYTNNVHSSVHTLIRRARYDKYPLDALSSLRYALFKCYIVNERMRGAAFVEGDPRIRLTATSMTVSVCTVRNFFLLIKCLLRHRCLLQ